MSKPTVEIPAGAIDTHAQLLLERGAAGAIERYLDALDSAGMAGGGLGQPDSPSPQHRTLLQAIARVPARFRGVAVVAPDCDPAEIEALKAQGVAGLRLNLLNLPAGF